ncbi:hypothetical protein [Clostridium sporogenes]|uniref:hypothetical protein n=1 Tax=Clostridium sporogenes TaxID=1509 RepID=UPI00223706B2|nr:hypothetical protein [Clostridium sporogenes]MCW6107824.1 hypothetical protein [Clostridium sporogenes]
MAKRPKMKTMQADIVQMKTKLQEHEERIKSIEEREIIKMLQEKNRPGSERPRYTYQEIAEVTRVSAGTVNNIAAKNNLSRRNLKPAK